MKLRFLILLIPFFLSTFLQSCDSDDPVSSMVSNISIEVMDVEVNRAYLKIRLDNTDSGLAYLIKLNDNSLEPVRITTTDTIVCLENLAQGNTYKISAAIYKKSTLLSRSNEEYITTLQPTSHSVQYNVYSYPSERGSHEVYDTFIRNNNNVFVSGINYISSTHKGFLYHFDGIELKPYSVELYFFDSDIYRTIDQTAEIGLVYSIENNLVIVAELWYQFLYTQVEEHIFRQISEISNAPSYPVDIIGFSLNDYYVLDHYYGVYSIKDKRIIQRIDNPLVKNPISYSGDYYFPSMTGINNPYKQTNKLYYLGNTFEDPKHSVLCTIENNENTDTTTIRTSDGVSDFRSIWTYSGFPVYVSGKGIATNRTGKWEYEEHETSADSLIEIKGTAPNNIFTIGNNGEILHYNGITWETVATESGIHWRRLDVKDNMIAAAGENFAKNEVYLLVGYLQ